MINHLIVSAIRRQNLNAMVMGKKTTTNNQHWEVV